MNDLFQFPDADGKVETRMRMTLSYDRSAVEDDAAAAFLDVLKELTETPTLLLLGGRKRHPLEDLL